MELSKSQYFIWRILWHIHFELCTVQKWFGSLGLSSVGKQRTKNNSSGNDSTANSYIKEMKKQRLKSIRTNNTLLSKKYIWNKICS